MKTINYTLDMTQDLTKNIDFSLYINEKNILVQVFSGEGKDVFSKVVKQLNYHLPHAVCIGATTDGEINDKEIYTCKTVVSISTFEKTEVKSAHINTGESFKDGASIAESLIVDNTKLLILFTDGSSSNGEDFVKGIESVNNKVIIAGGMAGDNANFIQTYISEGKHILDKGAVGVALNSDILQVHNDYSFNWNPIGVHHTVDKVMHNRVYQIDGITPVAFYAKYLGDTVANALPTTGIEFPLIVEKNGLHIARAVLSRHEDGSLSFAGNLKEGDKVKLGFGNAEMIISHPKTALEKFCKVSVESFFIYSCMARRRYMPDFIQVEIEPFAKLADVAGFFTYAEFYHHHGHNELFNQTLTAIALSESEEHTEVQNCVPSDNSDIKHSEYATTIQALTHLIKQSTADLEAKSVKLHKEKQFSQKLLANQKLFMRHAIHETITPLSVIMNTIELYEMNEGKNKHLSKIESAMKHMFTIYDDLSYLVKSNQLSYPKHAINLIDYMRSRIAFFDEVASQVDVSFTLQTPMNPIFIYFNETKLQRIVDNNLSNAIKYTLKDEIIYIDISEDNGYALLTFASKSTHIQDPKKVFNAYYRENMNEEGFGLGLNLVKQICEEEHVDIALSSDKEKTEFRYTFSLLSDQVHRNIL